MGTGKKKIEKESSRMITFSKRRKGLFKKADEFPSKTGSKVGILVISASGKPYSFGDIDVIDATLKSDSSLQKSGSINPQEEDCSRSEVSSSGSNVVSLKQWLDGVDVDNYNNIEDLLSLKKRLEEAESMMLRAEFGSWRLFNPQ